MKQAAFILIAIAIAISTGSLIVALQKDSPKIGIVDNAILMQQFTEAIRAKDELQSEKKKWQENIRSLEDSLQAVVDALGGVENGKVKGDRKALELKLQKWNREYTRYSDEVKRMAPRMEAEKFKPVLDKLNMFVNNWGAEKGYAAIYGTGTGGVILMRDARYDITSQVLADLNTLYKGDKAVPQADSSKAANAVNPNGSTAAN